VHARGVARPNGSRSSGKADLALLVWKADAALAVMTVFWSLKGAIL